MKIKTDREIEREERHRESIRRGVRNRNRGGLDALMGAYEHDLRARVSRCLRLDTGRVTLSAHQALTIAETLSEARKRLA